MEQGQEQKFNETLEMLSINSLTYTSPISASCTSQRSRTEVQFNPNAYPAYNTGDQMSINIGSGSSYVNTQTSSFNFALKVIPADGTGTYFGFGVNGADGDGDTFVNGGGSCLNLFSDVLLNARSGEQITKQNYFNIYSAGVLPYKKGLDVRQSLSTMGAAAYLTGNNQNITYGYPVYPCNVDNYFSIPLSMISSFFSTSQMLPPALLAGMALRITLANINSAIKLYTSSTGVTLASAPSAITANITKASLYLDQSQLFDSCSSLINASASSLANSGLQYSFNSYQGFKYSPASGSADLDVLLACAKVNRVWIKAVLKSGVTSTSLNDGIGCASFFKLCGNSTTVGWLGPSTDSYRVRLGSEYYPLYDIKLTSDAYNQVVNANQVQSFANCDDVDSMKSINKNMNCSIAYGDYSSLVSTTHTNCGTGCNILCVDLQKSQNINVSGLSTNNSRSLTCSLSGFSGLGAYNVYIFVDFISVANASIDNCVVDR